MNSSTQQNQDDFPIGDTSFETAKPRKIRVGKVVKLDSDSPATFKPGDPAKPIPTDFDAKAMAEELNLWRLDGAKGCHLRESKDGNFIDLSGDDFSRCLRRGGVKLKPAEGETLSQADELKDYVQEHRRVDFSMVSLAGHVSGTYSVSGVSMIVKKSPRLIEPKDGDWGGIRALIERMLEQPGTSLSQVTLFHVWMKLAMDHQQKSGLALILAGPRDCGKSLLQSLIITPLLGGRSADPGPHMFGDTDFNSELFGSEHLLMEDPAPKRGFSRETFSEKIKGIVANNTHRFHPKGKDAVTLSPKWHLSISLNDEPDTMMIIPEMREDISDKILLLRAKRPFDDDAFALPDKLGRTAFGERLRSQLPAYAHYLQSMAIEEGYQGRRFGLRAWQNPTLVSQLFEASPAGRLLELIDETRLWETEIRVGLEPGSGSHAEIQSELVRHLTQGDEAKGLFKVSRIELLLHKLSVTNPDRVKHQRLTSGKGKGRWIWQIMPPGPEV